jgi:hypothetical protein
MIIKESKYKNVMVKQRICVSDTVYGCDECKSELKDHPNEPNRLEITVFHKDSSSTDHLHLCSWACVINHIPKIKTNYFFTLPFVSFESDTPGKKLLKKRSGQELIKLLSKLKNK